MGQRLVITIENNNKNLAKIYYHWSAYTSSAFGELLKIMPTIQKWQAEKLDNNALRLALIRFLEENGGGIDGGVNSDEGEYIKKIFPGEEFSASPNRSEGLIAISEKGMEDMQSWSEGDITIHVDTNHISFYVYGGLYDSIEEFNEYYWDGESESYTLEDIPEAELPIEEISFDELEATARMILRCANESPYAIRYQGEIYGFIE